MLIKKRIKIRNSGTLEIFWEKEGDQLQKSSSSWRKKIGKIFLNIQKKMNIN